MFREVKAGGVISKETEMEELGSGSGRDGETLPVKSEVLKTDLSTVCEDIPTETSSLPGDIQSKPSDSNKTCEGEDTIHRDPDPSTKPSLSYVALIAKVILSSSSLKLNLASIYRAMEEWFPYFRARGSGGGPLRGREGPPLGHPPSPPGKLPAGGLQAAQEGQEEQAPEGAGGRVQYGWLSGLVLDRARLQPLGEALWE
ncbi:unnamed protein product [Coregonus sp. 'balchen']|nr:unnamed protein product [Coregonus sp. 'balchen']